MSQGHGTASPSPERHELLEQGRYELIRVLGSGSSGVVYEAIDHEVGARVALKRLRLRSPDDVLQLKNEFRSVSGIHHPKLVKLGRLICDHRECFFTMELVQGSTLDAAFARWPAGQRPLELVRRLAFDIAEALVALHAQGILHRDIKPTNILVDEAGAHLVDYGLASRMSSVLSMESRRMSRAGTLAYMSPEQIDGGEISFASDWFSFGVVLYETLHGVQPYSSPLRPVLVQDIPVAPETGVLGELCRDLLRRDPALRPRPAEVLERLSGQPESERRRDAEIWYPPFVGRASAMEELERVTTPERTRAVITTVRGVTGVGKTRLCHAFLERRERLGALVFRGRCNPNERVPFNALDAIVDDMTRILVHADAELRRHALDGIRERLVALFPVFGRVLAFDGAGTSVEATRCPEMPQLSRIAEAAEALATLLSRLARARAVFVFIDDLQYCDEESLELLARWATSEKAGGVSILGSMRTTDVGSSTPSPDLREGERVVVLGTLDEAEVEALRAAIQERWPLSREAWTRIVAKAQGSPGLLISSWRFLTTGEYPVTLTLDQLITSSVAGLQPDEARLATFIAHAGGLLPEAVGRELLTPARYEVARDGLERANLAHRVREPGGTALATAHEAVIEATRTIGSLAMEVHAQLADAYRRVFDLDRPFELIGHLEHAGALESAASVALSAAIEATRFDRHDHAARLFSAHLRLTVDSRRDPRVLELHGESLLRCGRPEHAAQAFVDAAEEVATDDSPEAARLWRRAADVYLRSGRYDTGRAILARLLSDIGVKWPSTPGGAIRSIVWHRLHERLGPRPHPERPHTSLSDNRARLDLLWSACGSVSLYDALACFAFQARHARLAAKAADPRHLALSTSTKALFTFFEHGVRKDEEVRRLLALAEQWATHDPSQEVVSYLHFMRASISYARGSFAHALSEARRGIAHSHARHPEGHWERANLAWLECLSLVQLGDFLEAEQRHAALRNEASDTGDNYLRTLIGLDFTAPIYWVRDQADAGREFCRESLRRASSSAYLDACYAIGAVPLELYDRGSAAAHELLEEHYARLRKVGALMRLTNVRLEINLLLGVVGLARIVDGGAPPGALATVKRAARVLSAAPERPACHLGHLFDAQLCHLGLAPGSAAHHLHRAISGFEEAGAGFYLGAAQLFAATLGMLDLDEIQTSLRARGWVDPLRVAAVWAPALRAYKRGA